MEINGILVKKLKVEAGTSKAGKAWKSQLCIIDTNLDFKNQVAIKFMGDKISLLDNVNEGDDVTVSCNVYSREYNGRFYNNIDGWKISSNNAEINEAVNDELNGRVEMDRQDQGFVTSNDNDLSF
tara:strand:+ start:261 stop:635 length:375 start_codon:yes stop_codon:yes gene_type:complete